MFQQFFDRFRHDRDDSGAQAERLAADWLHRHRGFQIVARNWTNPRDNREEIDLVCRDRDVLVFVEVKARVADSLVAGYFAVNARKKRVLTRACKAYLARLRPTPLTFRFDVVEVVIPRAVAPSWRPAPVLPDNPPVRHFENVPLFSKSYRG